MKKITVFGGGTGSFVILSALKQLPVDLAAIVTMTDAGGSTGRLRDQLGVLPPGDLRQCLLALSEASLLWRRLFLYRFTSGDLRGHNFGNLFLTALEKVTDNYQAVIDTASYVLKVKGEVIPVTLEKTHLLARYADGTVKGNEAEIEANTRTTSRIVGLELNPTVQANRRAIARVKQSDWIILGPGDLFTSIVPILLVKEINILLRTTRAKIVYVMNLMTKSGQTTHYSASDHLRDLEHYLGRPVDLVIVNRGKIQPDVLEWYLRWRETPVSNDLASGFPRQKRISRDLVDRRKFQKEPGDVLSRSLVRHDKTKLSRLLKTVILP
ncbi:YvcK family protein [Patescibacteria group bacterium]|nr:YvcK family protein [Patescibacteria group bacterium]MCL5091770.1 YvcK family protein [Patescibacteria group bacterium]